MREAEQIHDGGALPCIHRPKLAWNVLVFSPNLVQCIERQDAVLVFHERVPGLEGCLAFSPSTVGRRAQRRMEGLPVRPRGRPRDVGAARRARLLEQRLEKVEERLAQSEAEKDRFEQEQIIRRDAQLICLQALGLSLRGTQDAQALGFGELGLRKSAIAERLKLCFLAGYDLFGKHFGGQGTEGCGDEGYISGHPILEMVEPRSLAITGLKPHTAPSRQAWEAFLDEFAELRAAVSDEGRGLRAAIQAKLEVNGLDQWHLTRSFGAAVKRLENAAYSAMEAVERCLDRFIAELPCPAGTKLPPSLIRLEEAQRAMEKAIEVYDSARTVQIWLSEAADPVDRHGRVRSPRQVAEDWEAALDLVDQIDAEALYPIADKLRSKRDGAHLRGLQARVEALRLPLGFVEAERIRLQELGCQAWRYHHRRKTHLLDAPLEASDWVAKQLSMPFVAPHLHAYLTALFEMLDRTLKASSAVECVNSIFRLGEGVKRPPHPKMVFLLAWLHNTRPFKEGRRKGLTPAQLLGVSLPKDGWTMLLERMDVIRERQAAERRAKRAASAHLN